MQVAVFQVKTLFCHFCWGGHEGAIVPSPISVCPPSFICSVYSWIAWAFKMLLNSSSQHCSASPGELLFPLVLLEQHECFSWWFLYDADWGMYRCEAKPLPTAPRLMVDLLPSTGFDDFWTSVDQLLCQFRHWNPVHSGAVRVSGRGSMCPIMTGNETYIVNLLVPNLTFLATHQHAKSSVFKIYYYFSFIAFPKLLLPWNDFKPYNRKQVLVKHFSHCTESSYIIASWVFLVFWSPFPALTGLRVSLCEWRGHLRTAPTQSKRSPSSGIRNCYEAASNHSKDTKSPTPSTVFFIWNCQTTPRIDLDHYDPSVIFIGIKKGHINGDLSSSPPPPPPNFYTRVRVCGDAFLTQVFTILNISDYLHLRHLKESREKIKIDF